MSGVLYVVATPIGHLSDISFRALEVLKAVDVVLAEDTRQTKKLFDHYAVSTRLLALHEHNERQMLSRILARLETGDSLALVSDAGTPLISDPGYPLVRACRQAGFEVRAIPGPSALVAALSISGLPTDSVKFLGFLPHKSSARRVLLASQAQESATLVFYESTHRLLAALEDVIAVYGDQRELVIAKELTKQYERVLSGSPAVLLEQLKLKPELQKGEFVLLLAGCEKSQVSQGDLERVLKPLLRVMSVKQAAGVAAEITGEKKNRLYELALNLRDAG